MDLFYVEKLVFEKLTTLYHQYLFKITLKDDDIMAKHLEFKSCSVRYPQLAS